jgi:hypothetical protein
VFLCGSGGNFSDAKQQMHGTSGAVTGFEPENPFHDIAHDDVYDSYK